MKTTTSSSSSTAVGLKRLQKEYIALQKQPVENITARPDEKNIFEWHYCIKGPDDSCYKDGYYYGLLKFPSEYPFKPPAIMMVTPNGRFKTNVRLCLSMSDFHPETWNPMWSVSSILSGLLSFMLDEAPTHGSMTATREQRQLLARASMDSNTKNKIFVKMFPEIVDEFKGKSRNSRGESIMTDSTTTNVARMSVASEHSDNDVPVPANEVPAVKVPSKPANTSQIIASPAVSVVNETKSTKAGGSYYYAFILMGMTVTCISYVLHHYQQQQQQVSVSEDSTNSSDNSSLMSCNV